MRRYSRHICSILGIKLNIVRYGRTELLSSSDSGVNSYVIDTALRLRRTNPPLNNTVLHKSVKRSAITKVQRRANDAGWVRKFGQGSGKLAEVAKIIVITSKAAVGLGL
jgi:hypothetical protein